MTSWEDVARTRATESGALADGGHYLGAVYLQGYNIECLLKRFHQIQGKPFPEHGKAGHDLKGLWQSSGLTAAPRGHSAEFLEAWSTNLRYEVALPAGSDAHTLMAGAIQIANRLNTRIRAVEVKKNKRRSRRRDS